MVKIEVKKQNCCKTGNVLLEPKTQLYTNDLLNELLPSILRFKQTKIKVILAEII